MICMLQEISEPKEFIDQITGFSKERDKALYRSYCNGQCMISENCMTSYLRIHFCLYVPSNFR